MSGGSCCAAGLELFAPEVIDCVFFEGSARSVLAQDFQVDLLQALSRFGLGQRFDATVSGAGSGGVG